ncbi:hypothetical protein [Rhizobium tumorigenes]|uniref:Uncharacterized protein n=1 Tax=Rhizobium tumorigenes TaxID=2041385 RepID=A0AAF1KTW0_9HYPH|nr:hypothetical protein [Rhizobium tumorigenes]WFR97720.1 hypothetical protein PR017_21370 [Rhizobium tumorigenes]
MLANLEIFGQTIINLEPEVVAVGVAIFVDDRKKIVIFDLVAASRRAKQDPPGSCLVGYFGFCASSNSSKMTCTM